MFFFCVASFCNPCAVTVKEALIITDVPAAPDIPGMGACRNGSSSRHWLRPVFDSCRLKAGINSTQWQRLGRQTSIFEG